MEREHAGNLETAGVIEGLRRWVEARADGESSPPEAWELLAVHALYWLSGGLVIRALLAVFRDGKAIGASAMDEIMAMATLCTLLLLWAGVRRRPLAENWFVSHLLWLSMTYGVLAAAFAGSLLLVAVLLIVGVLLPPLLFLMYALMALAWVFAAWFVWRIGRGYLALLGRAAAGSYGG